MPDMCHGGRRFRPVVLVACAFCLVLVTGAGVVAGDPVAVEECEVIDQPGTYELTQNFTSNSFECIEIESNDVILDGMGHTIDLEDNDEGVRVTDVTNVTVTNLTVVDGSSSSYAVHFQNVSGGEISDVTANGTDRGLWVEEGVNNTVRDNIVENTGDYGFYVDVETNLTIEQNDLMGTGSDAVNLNGVVNVTIGGNDITESHFDGINAENSDNVTIAENHISDAGQDGIELDGEGSALVHDNEITNATSHGIVASDYDHTNVSDNRVNGSLNDGITIDGDGPMRAENNTVTGIGDGDDSDFGIDVSGDNATVVDNDVEDINASGTDGAAVNVVGDYARVANNDISNSSWNGIWLTDTAHSLVESNIVNDSNGYGIRSYLGTNLTVAGNTVRRSGIDGFYVLASFGDLDGLAVRENTIEDSTNRSIGLELECDATISNTSVESNELVNGTTGVTVVSEVPDESWCDSHTPFTNLTVSDNVVRDVRSNGLVVDVRNENTTLTDVTFAGGNVSNSANHAVFFDNATNVTVSDVTLHTAGGDGVHLNASSGNTFSNVTVSDAMEAAVRFANGSQNVATDLHLGAANASFEALDVAISDVDSLPQVPEGQTDIGASLDATNTSASGYLDLAFNYTDAQVADVDESELSVWEHDGTDWAEVGGSSVDTGANTVSANLTSFSTFAPLAESSRTASGTVTDGVLDEPVEDATVTFDDGSVETDVTTNASGEYNVSLPGGTYDVTATASVDGRTLVGTIDDLDLTSTTTDADVTLWDDLDGNGTENSPFEITGLTELQSMQGNLSADYVLESDVEASATGEWNGGAGFDPVGAFGTGNEFTGTFDGNGHAISNLTIDRPGEDYVGLFGWSSGTVSNVTIRDANVTGQNHVGGLVGENEGTATSSSVTGTVTGTDYYVGGLVGLNFHGSVTDSYATAIVNGTDEVGGLVGYNWFGTVTDTFATGAINGPGADAGGLVGSNDGTVTDSHATGPVEGTTVGGLVGSNDETVTDSYATGSVEGSSRGGGLVGSNGGTVERTYATGNVSCGGCFDSGGLVGSDSGTVNESYWDVNTTNRTASDGDEIGLTTDEMQGAATEGNMTGFDFGGNWTATDEYPHLRWEVQDLGLELGSTELEPGDSTSAPVTLDLADGSTLTATETANYTSDNESVVTVADNGTVTAVAEGTANVTAVAIESDTLAVTVLDPANLATNTSTLGFGAVEVGTDTSSETVRIENVGGLDLNLTATSILGVDASEFAITGGDVTSTVTLQPGETHNVTVEFEPNTRIGAKTANLTVESNDPDEATFEVGLSGTGEDTTDPTAVAGANQSVTEDTEVPFDASNSTDNGQIASYEWEFGDGANATGVTTNHTYAQPGTYAVNLTVTDDAGNEATDSLSVTVRSRPDRNDRYWNDDEEDDEGNETAADRLTADLENGEATFDVGGDVVRLEIVFDGDASGTVAVESPDALPDEVDAIPDATPLAIVDVTVPESLADSAATLRLTLDADALGDADPSTLVVYHDDDGEWVALETAVVSATDDEVVVEATTPGFSLFAVGQSAGGTTPGEETTTTVETTRADPTTAEPTTTDRTATPDPDASTPADDGETDRETADEESTGYAGLTLALVVLVVVLALVGLVVLLRRRHSSRP